MATFRNISPLGELDVPSVGIVEADATFEVADELAPHYEGQTANFERLDARERDPGAEGAPGPGVVPSGEGDASGEEGGDD